MMRAWAAISVAAVLVALPVSVGRAAGDGAVAPVAGSGVAVTGVPSTNLGVMLWLSVAVVAAIAACLVLHHSRTHFAPATDTAAPRFPFSSGTPTGGADDAAPSTAIGD